MDRAQAENSSEPSRTMKEVLYIWADAGHPSCASPRIRCGWMGELYSNENSWKWTQQPGQPAHGPDFAFRGVPSPPFWTEKRPVSTIRGRSRTARGSIGILEFSRKPALLFRNRVPGSSPKAQKANRFRSARRIQQRTGGRGCIFRTSRYPPCEQFQHRRMDRTQVMAPPDGAQQLSRTRASICRSFGLNQHRTLQKRQQLFNVDAALVALHIQGHSGISLVCRGRRFDGASEDLSGERSDVQKRLLDLRTIGETIFFSIKRKPPSHGRKHGRRLQECAKHSIPNSMEWESYIKWLRTILRPRIQPQV